MKSIRARKLMLVRRTVDGALAIAAMVMIVVAAAAPAQAHAELVSSDPRDSAEVVELPEAVSFTFSENVAAPAFVAVTAPDGSSIIDGDPQILDATITQAVTPADEKGIYTMSYRVTSSDGHPVSGTVRFEVTSGREVAQVEAPTEPATSGEDSGSGGHPTEAALAIVVVVLGIVLLIGSGRTARGRDRRG